MSSISKVFLAALLLISCTTTITKTKSPKFTETNDSLAVTLDKLIRCQHVNVNGEEVTTNGKTRSVLEIDIVNGKQAPEDTAAIKALGKSIGSAVKKALADKNEYDVFKVLFVKQEEKAGVTTRSWQGSEYKSVDL